MPGNSKSSLLRVPERGDPDRRRALNVLAQRRYRQRRRERIGALERKVMEISALSESNSSSSTMPESDTPSDEAENAETLQSNSNPDWDFSNATQVLATSSSDAVMAARHVDSWCFVTDPSFDVGNIDQSPNMSSGGLDQDPLLEFMNITPINFGSNASANNADMSAELQSLESMQFTFPDDAELNVPELKVLHAGLGIAQLLDCEHTIWNPNTTRILDIAVWQRSPLPPNLKPTDAQMRIPHHPLFDILPWPSVRSKLIYIFAQPVHLRPPAARDPLALMNMVLDIDDSSEGMRVNGSDGFDPENWEVGQLFFAHWWWALDRSIIEKSNASRARRGANRLQLMQA